jgi:hypothetical protein
MKKREPVRRLTVQVQNTLALPHRAEATARMLQSLNTIFAELLADENFVTLLQAESRTMIPEYLRKVLDEGKVRHDLT